MAGITDRIDNVTRIPPEYMKAVVPAPKSVKIEISPRCNYRCGFCALRTREVQPKWDMDFGLFKRMTREMRDARVQEIGVFYLGESFMNPRLLVDCIAWVKRQRVAGKLFHRALDNVKSAWELRQHGGYTTGLYASSIKYDGAQFAKMASLLAERVRPYVDQHYWLPLYSMGAFATQREAELGYRPTAGNQGRLDALRAPLLCWSAFTESHVTAEGKLSACCFDATANWTMGDLTKVPFMQAWNSAPFVKLREAHLKRDVRGTVCEPCIAYGGDPLPKPVRFVES